MKRVMVMMVDNTDDVDGDVVMMVMMVL